MTVALENQPTPVRTRPINRRWPPLQREWQQAIDAF